MHIRAGGDLCSFGANLFGPDLHCSSNDFLHLCFVLSEKREDEFSCLIHQITDEKREFTFFLWFAHSPISHTMQIIWYLVFGTWCLVFFHTVQIIWLVCCRCGSFARKLFNIDSLHFLQIKYQAIYIYRELQIKFENNYDIYHIIIMEKKERSLLYQTFLSTLQLKKKIKIGVRFAL